MALRRLRLLDRELDFRRDAVDLDEATSLSAMGEPTLPLQLPQDVRVAEPERVRKPDRQDAQCRRPASEAEHIEALRDAGARRRDQPDELVLQDKAGARQGFRYAGRLSTEEKCKLGLTLD